MKPTTKFALAYTRAARGEIGQPNESIIRQKEAIHTYAQECGYTIVDYVEHINRSGLNYDFDWITESIAKDIRIRYVLVYTSDRFCRNFYVANTLKTYLEEKYNVIVDTVTKFHPCSLIN
ncbi:MAG: recombinase family protein [Chitinophagaceae bacterium]